MVLATIWSPASFLKYFLSPFSRRSVNPQCASRDRRGAFLGKRIARSIPSVIAILTSLHLTCVDAGVTPHNPTKDKMYVYSNTAQRFYLIDYKTFNIVKEIPLVVPEGVSLQGMTLSTNRDHLFFRTWGPYNESPLGFAIYDIGKEEFREMFITELNHPGPVTFIAAEDESTPGLIFAHLRDAGTYTIDLFEKRVVEKIWDEHDFALEKRIYHSPNGQWSVVSKKQHVTGVTELQFHTRNSKLHDLQFVLNENNRDSIWIYDLAFSGVGDEKLHVSYQLSGGRSRDVESYFGGYDLGTRQLTWSPLRFPWSLSGYFLAYGAERNEVYCAGNDGQFYVIDGNTLSIKDTVALAIIGKREQSPIIITPNESAALIAYNSDIFMIDLNDHNSLKTIRLEEPYWMIIP